MNRELYKYERDAFFSCGGKGRGLCLYNEKGQRLNIYYGNNTKTRYYYNVLNFRLERILTTRNGGQDILQDLNYEFDAVGNITKITDDAQQTHYFNNQVIAPTGTYEYDALYRLTKATGRELTSLTAPNENDFANDIPCPDVAGNAMQNYLHNYQYDALGNMLSDNWKDYVYDTVTNRLLKHDTQQNTNDYTYDQHGNILMMPHLNTLNWDYKDQLISASNGTFISYYNYDAQGNRTRKVVEKGNVKEERYYVNGYEIYKKYTNNTLDFERKTLNISDDEKVFVRIEQKTGENEVIRFQYDNHLGSACLELDDAGAIISYEEYHPFGTTSYRSGRSETEVSLKRYKYNGKERDEETGLYYYGARYYATWLCRFISTDPLKEKYPNWSPYAYCLSNPLIYIDPDGKQVRPTRPSAPRPSRNNYATFGNGMRISSYQNTFTTIYRYSAYQNTSQTESFIPPTYVVNHTTPYRYTSQMSVNNTRGQVYALLGDGVRITMDYIEKWKNTSQGMRVERYTQIRFENPTKQMIFSYLQREYEANYKKVYNSIEYTPDENLSDFDNSRLEYRYKTMQTKRILGPSPQEILNNELKNNTAIETVSETTKTEIIPEIYATPW